MVAIVGVLLLGFDSGADVRDLARMIWGRTHNSRPWVGYLGSMSALRSVFRGVFANKKCILSYKAGG